MIWGWERTAVVAVRTFGASGCAPEGVTRSGYIWLVTRPREMAESGHGLLIGLNRDSPRSRRAGFWSSTYGENVNSGSSLASSFTGRFEALRRRGVHVVVLGVVALLLSALFASAEAAAVTPTATGSVVVTRLADGDKDLYLRELGTGDERLLVPDVGQEHSAVYSPDGTKIAFVRETAGNAEVYVVNADGTGLVNVSDHIETDLNPAWTPDSASVVFDSNRPSNGLRQIYKVALADTDTVSRITTSEQWENYEPSVSPDGSWVAHATSEFNVPEEFLLVQIYKTHIATKSVAPLTQTNPGKNRNPEWSPDGTQIAFSSNRVNGAADYDIWVMDAAGDNEVYVTSSASPENFPRWVTHDGRGATPRLLYVSDADLKMIDVARTNDGVVLDDATLYLSGDMQPLSGCSIVWDGSAAANNWDDAANWDLGRVPAAGDRVCIPGMQTDVTILQTTDNPTVDSITTYENLTISGGTVTSPVVTARPGAHVRVVGGTLNATTGVTAADGSFTVAGGTANIGALTSTGTGALTLTSGTLNATSIAPATTMALNGGTLGGPVSLASGTFTMPNSGPSSDGDPWTIASTATLDLTSTGTYYMYGSVVNNGTLNLSSASNLVEYVAGATLTNTASGEVVKDATNSSTTLSLPFDNDGVLDVQAGTVTLTGTDGSSYAANNDAGTFNTDGDDATVSFAGGRTNLGSATALTGTGRFELVGSSTILDVDTHGLTMPDGQTMHLTSGTLRGSGTLAGPVYKLTNSVTVGGAFTIHADTVLDLTSTGTYYLEHPLTNNGTLNLNSASNLYESVTGATLTNTGTLVKDAVNSTTTISTPLDNTGTARVTAGTMTLGSTLTSNAVTAFDAATGTFSSGGTYEVADNATLSFNGTREIAINAGQFELSGTGNVVDNTAQSVFRNLTTNRGMLALRAGSTLTTAAPLTNESLVSIGSDSTLTALGGYTQTNSGLTRLFDETNNGIAPRLVAPTATFESGRLEGNGTIDGDVVNNAAVVSPGIYAPGALTVTGTFAQASDGTFEADVHGTAADEFDRITVQGTAALAGDLQITGHLFTPDWNDQFTVLSAGSAPTMTFDLVTGDDLNSGMKYVPTVVGNAVKLVVTDVVSPTNVTPTASHKASTWSKDNTVTVNLTGASDAHSGVDGYRVVWSTSPTTVVTGSKNVEETVAAVTSAPLPSGKGHYVHIRTKDNQGRWSGQVNLGPFWIDTTAPTLPVLSTPTTATPYSLATKSMVPQVGAVWKVAKDAHSGLKSHAVLYRSTTNGTTWTSGSVLLGAEATSWSTAGKPGATYCFKVRATDNRGTTSLSEERCASVPFDTGTGFTATGTWTKPVTNAHYLGSTSRSTATNATLSRKSVVAKQLALVATKCAGCGSVQVYFGGVAVGKVINLNTTSATPLHQQVIPVASLGGVKTGTVMVKVVSTGNKPVMIDAVGTSLR